MIARQLKLVMNDCIHSFFFKVEFVSILYCLLLKHGFCTVGSVLPASHVMPSVAFLPIWDRDAVGSTDLRSGDFTQ